MYRVMMRESGNRAPKVVSISKTLELAERKCEEIKIKYKLMFNDSETDRTKFYVEKYVKKCPISVPKDIVQKPERQKHYYKGFEFYNHNDLADLLGVTSGTIYIYLEKNNTTYEAYIDRWLANEDYRIRPETMGEYKGISWHNHSDLAKQLGVTRQFICRISKKGRLNDYLDGRIFNGKIRNKEW